MRAALPRPCLSVPSGRDFDRVGRTLLSVAFDPDLDLDVAVDVDLDFDREGPGFSRTAN